MTYVKCGLCSKGNEKGADDAYCTTFFERKAGSSEKRGCLAIHTA